MQRYKKNIHFLGYYRLNRKGRKETLRTLGILWELCGKKIKER